MKTIVTKNIEVIIVASIFTALISCIIICYKFNLFNYID